MKVKIIQQFLKAKEHHRLLATSPTNALVLDFQPPKLGDEKLLFFGPSRLRYLVTEAPDSRYTQQLNKNEGSLPFPVSNPSLLTALLGPIGSH